VEYYRNSLACLSGFGGNALTAHKNILNRFAGVAVLTLPNDLTAAAEDVIAPHVEETFEPEPTALVLDLSSVRLLTTAGAGLLISFIEGARGRHIPVYLAGAGPKILGILHRIGIAPPRVLEQPGVAEALEHAARAS
jgi:anti-anti-sigma regulatory factor